MLGIVALAVPRKTSERQHAIPESPARRDASDTRANAGVGRLPHGDEVGRRIKRRGEDELGSSKTQWTGTVSNEGIALFSGNPVGFHSVGSHTYKWKPCGDRH